MDYDSDNDGYIDVANLAQLNAIRHDLDGNGDPTSGGATAYGAAFPNRVTTSSGRMGCPSGTCAGYELTASLDFDSDSDGDVDANDHSGAYWDTGKGWQMIGTSFSDRYTAKFKGNGHTIDNLFINRTGASDYAGLFGYTSSNARIETLGVINANVTGNDYAAILVGVNLGEIIACYTTGKAQGDEYVGGLLGYSTGHVFASYSTAYVSGRDNVGGLIGSMVGNTTTSTYTYSTGRVVRSSGTATTIGGLTGSIVSDATVTASYWDTSTSGCVTGGSNGCTTSAGGTGKTTRQLQTPTGYTGIYANWNTDLDNADADNDATTGKDDPWAFGNKMQYPMLDYDGMSTTPQNSQAMGRSANWNAPIVGERVSVCVTGATRPNRSGLWIWEKSPNGYTWTAVAGNSGASYEYYPVSTDVGNYLRAKAPLNDGTFVYTRALGGRVKETSAATAGSAITFVSGNASPQVGTQIVASDPRPTGAVNARFSWQRCDNADTTYTDCSYIYGVWWTKYTPTTADVGKYLRMVVYYATSSDTWTRHTTAFTGQVAAASQ